MIIRIRRVIISSHRLKNTFLEWPLQVGQSSKIRFSRHLKDFEAHWAKKANQVPVPTKSQKYILAMFPYPSGSLHMGHMRVYTLSDVIARYYRLNGYEVIHPIGWDAFGLPAENAARERGIDSREWTELNISTMRKQLMATGINFDWDREIKTCDPEYYRWNQWIFLKLYEKGLAKRILSEVNWDPVDGTVLADEQIDENGRSWRSGALAEKRVLRQWAIETPRYAERLSRGLVSLAPQWDDVALIQANWLGTCDVYRFLLPLKNFGEEKINKNLAELDLRLLDPCELITSPVVILSQDHTLADKTRKDITDPYKLDVEVLNRATGANMPIVVAPQKLFQMAPNFLGTRLSDDEIDREWLNSLGLSAKPSQLIKNQEDILQDALSNGYGGYRTSRIHRDWIVSRQRAWGTPIPMVLSKDGVLAAPVDTRQLPILQGNTQERSFVKHPMFPTRKFTPDPDTLDTFFDSSWYYLRYLDPHNSQKLVDFEKAARAMPVDVYVGGVEHAALHMFYARFMCHFLYDIGVSPVEEPFQNLIPQGIVRAKTFYMKSTGKYLQPNEVKSSGSEFVHIQTGEVVEKCFEKMSKSKHNGVDPMEALKSDGKDLTRLQLLYSAAPRSVIDWGEFDTRGLVKWLDRVSRIVSNYIDGRRNASELKFDQMDEKIRTAFNTAVKKVTWNLEELQLHRQALCDLMTFANAINDITPSCFARSQEAERALRGLLVMMQLFAPHATLELWSAMQSVSPISKLSSKELIEQPWPETDHDAEMDFFLKMHGEKFDTTSHAGYEIESLDKNAALLLKKNTLQASGVWDLTNIKELEALGHRISPISHRARKGIFYELEIAVEPPIRRDSFKELLSQVGHRRDEVFRTRKKTKRKQASMSN